MLMKKLLTLLTLSFACCTSFAQAFVLYDADDHSVVVSSNSLETKSVASLTKIMTAMVYVDSGNYNQRLLERLLIRSDNAAADKIARDYPGGYTLFIKAMNDKAESLGLHETFFHDPSGISSFNRSTAREYVDIVLEANKYPLIRQISSTYEKKIEVGKKKSHTIRNTNSLLKEYDNIVLSKTGFTSKAGRCLALFVENGAKHYVIVILGEPSPEKRAKTARKLISMIN
jgi:D-alanyl-D-alanine endopeptidase (penicillin-binding protein 7)